LFLCKDYEIVILLDGDDWLAHDTVFSLINTTYQTQDVWFTYGQYINVPEDEALKWGFTQKGYCTPVSESIIKNNSYRKEKFVYMHMRSFYAWIFKQIKLEDLMAYAVKGYEGDFYPASNDLAIFYPIVEMSHMHTLFIPEVIYIRNLYSDIVGFKVDALLQRQSAVEIRYRKKPYTALQYPVYKNIEQYKKRNATVFVLVEIDFSGIEDFLYNLFQRIRKIDEIIIFFKTSKSNQQMAELICQQFTQCTCIPYDTIRNGFKKSLIHGIAQTHNNHIFFTTPDLFCVHDIDAGDMIYWLERTQAHAFYTTKEIPQTKQYRWMLSIEDAIVAWNFKLGNELWPENSAMEMTLYKKDTLLELLHKLDFNSVNDLRAQLNMYLLPQEKIGIFYPQAQCYKKF
jgi:hypothetical protein